MINEDMIEIVVTLNPKVIIKNGKFVQSETHNRRYLFRELMCYLATLKEIDFFTEEVANILVRLDKKYNIGEFEISTSWGDETKIVLSFDEVEDCVRKICKEYFGGK